MELHKTLCVFVMHLPNLDIIYEARILRFAPEPGVTSILGEGAHGPAILPPDGNRSRVTSSTSQMNTTVPVGVLQSPWYRLHGSQESIRIGELQARKSCD